MLSESRDNLPAYLHQQNTLGFSATFAYCIPLGFSKADAAVISSVLSASFVAGRLASIFISTQLKTKTMLCGSFVIMTTGNVLLLMFASDSIRMVWLSFVVIGLGNSCVYTCILSFVEERINVTTSVCAFFILSSCLPSLVTPVLLGRFLEEYPLVYVYVNIACLSVCCITFLLVLLLDKHISRKNTSDQINK